MFKHILIPTDGSPRSEEAVRKGIQFAHDINARVTCFHAIAKFQTSDVMMGVLETSGEGGAEAATLYATEHLRFVSKTAQAHGVPCDVEHATSDNPAQSIIRVAKSRGCDLILMASHGRRGIEGLLLGSETHKVLTHCHIPVLVYR